MGQTWTSAWSPPRRAVEPEGSVTLEDTFHLLCKQAGQPPTILDTSLQHEQADAGTFLWAGAPCHGSSLGRHPLDSTSEAPAPDPSGFVARQADPLRRSTWRRHGAPRAVGRGRAGILEAGGSSHAGLGEKQTLLPHLWLSGGWEAHSAVAAHPTYRIHAETAQEGVWGGMSIAGSAATCLSPSLPSFPPVSIALIHALTPNAWISPLICSLRPPFAYSSLNSFVLMCYLEPPTGAPPTPRQKCDCCSLMGAATCTQALPLDFGEQISEASPASRGANSAAEQAGRCPGFLTCDFLASTVDVLKAVSFHTDAGAQHV